MSRLDMVEDWAEFGEKAGYDAKEVAAICIVSDSQLRRYFVRNFGKAPQHWLNELRLWHAARLLCSGLRVKEVAIQLNFSSQPNFCHRFKEFHKLAPLHYVERHYLRSFSQRTPIAQGDGPPPAQAAPWYLGVKKLCEKGAKPASPRAPKPRKNVRRRQ